MVRVEVLGSDYLQHKRDVTRMRCTRKWLNCNAHTGDDQNNGGHVENNPAYDRAYAARYPDILYRSVVGVNSRLRVRVEVLATVVVTLRVRLWFTLTLILTLIREKC